MRYLLDTNIAGEPLKSSPDQAVMTWLDSIADDDAALPTPVLGELLFGVQRLQAGRRREALMTQLRALAERLP